MSLAGMAARSARNRNNRFEQPDAARSDFAAIAGEFERDPWDRNVPDPGKSIPITPEILAEEAREQEAVEAARQLITWQMPTPIAQPNYRRPLKRKQLAHKPAHTKLQPAKPQTAPPKPAATPQRTISPQLWERRKMPTPAKFTIHEAVKVATLPPPRTIGRVSPYLDLYEAVKKVQKEHALPVGVDEVKAGYAMSQSLRKMADKDEKKLVMRRSDDGKTFYFYTTEKRVA